MENKRRGGPRGRGGNGRGTSRARESAGSASYRVLNELSGLEKSLAKGDFAEQKQPLGEIVKALKPLRLKSIEELDFNTRGRLITTLLRVSRQPKPAEAAPAAADVMPPAEADAAPAEAAPQVLAEATAAPKAPEPSQIGRAHV